MILLHCFSASALDVQPIVCFRHGRVGEDNCDVGASADKAAEGFVGGSTRVRRVACLVKS